MCTVREINDPAELASYRLLWTSLLAETRQASFFQSLDWLETYWRHFGAGHKLRVLVIYSGTSPVGILPLVVRHERRRWGRVRVLTYPLDHWGSFFGPLGPNPTATLIAGMKHVARTLRDWDVLELPWVDRTRDGSRTPLALENAGFGAIAEPWRQTALVDLAGQKTWNAYWASRSSRWRNNVRRSEKKTAEHGRIDYLRYRPAGAAQGDADPRWDLFEACQQIAQASWQGSSQTGTTLCHEAVRPFLRDCHLAAARAGSLDLNLLLLDERPIAFNYAYHYRGHVFGLRTGFDAQAVRDGAGSVLQARTIEDSFARGDHTYDLGPDYLECKRNWRTETRASYRYTHFAPSPRAQVARLRRGFAGWLSREVAPVGV